MDRNQILEMPAGRPFDLIIEQDVMESTLWLEQRGEYEYVIRQKKGEREPWFGTRHWEQAKERYSPFRAADYNPREHVLMDAVPRYTGDIGAAWQVNEHCRSRIYSRRQAYVRNLQDVISRRIGIPNVSIGHKVAPGEIILLVEPVDICRAALLAMPERQEVTDE